MVNSNLYNKDFSLWIESTVNSLKNRQYQNVDWDSLIEEIESMGKSDKRALLSFLTRLIEHLLKLKYWEIEKERNRSGWIIEVINLRSEIEAILDDSPSLRNYLSTIYPKAHAKAIKTMSQAFYLPNNATVSLENALDENYLPE